MLSKETIGGLTFVLKFGKVNDAVRLVGYYGYMDGMSEEMGVKTEINVVFRYANVANITLPKAS